jgi:hypothetical protein
MTPGMILCVLGGLLLGVGLHGDPALIVIAVLVILLGLVVP